MSAHSISEIGGDPVNEPGNHTALVCRFGCTWVRVDECPAHDGGTWWPITDGPSFCESVHDQVGWGRTWEALDEYQPFRMADSDRTARALELVRREVAR